MRRIISVFLVVTCIFLLAGCVGNGKDTAVNTNSSLPASESVQPSGDVQTAQPSSTASTETSAVVQSSSPSAGIIAESSNTVSDKEKQDQIDDLTAQLDSALTGVDNLEDLDDSDLNENNID